jgi:hypothetical protein
MDFEGVEANYIAETSYVAANVKMYAGPGGHRGELTAWDPATGRAFTAPRRLDADMKMALSIYQGAQPRVICRVTQSV